MAKKQSRTRYNRARAGGALLKVIDMAVSNKKLKDNLSNLLAS